ncbi:reverse transcriptase domain-containing protein [Paraburkholderia sp. SIMBA_054]|uniref:reverse transcriptase domain-containing protein n=1 Tax=Paraburkholderia sp. SIMBA_054 TaxID=3085795 RepID=UPI00397BE99E
MLLEPIYEQDFFDSSYGFRPRRSALQALQAVRAGVMERRGKRVLDVDVRKYFDSIDRTGLREFLANRVTDGVVRRLIDKWLKAGVLEDGQLFYPDKGVSSVCHAMAWL